MANYETMTKAELDALLEYHPETGAFVWRVSRSSITKGSVAGSVTDKGYWAIGIKRNFVPAHRLAWLLHMGCWPKGPIDHINGNPLDNRIANLREVSQLLNTQNRRKANKGTRSGLIGASWKSKIGRWVAQIRHDGRLIHIGYFDTAEAANAAYLSEKRKLHAGMV